MTPTRHDFPLHLVNPEYGSDLTDVIMELQYLRRLRLGGSTPAPVFFELKSFFHLLESLNSARIEGNRKTIVDAVEARIEQEPERDDALHEISNMEKAMVFIEEALDTGTSISKGFILELHKRVVDGLEREGDQTPGEIRKKNVEIQGSPHLPPDFTVLQDYIDEFLAFINAPQDPKYDLLRVALAHHRFAWVHPFNNGNGRVVRLLTYAMLIARGFNVRTGRILNPSAVFCSDRKLYYQMLANADDGTDTHLLEWSEYVLRGLLREMQKIDKLLDYGFLAQRILRPAIQKSLERRAITELEAKILYVAIDKQVFKAYDIETLTPNKIPAERSRILGKMRTNKLIKPIADGARQYSIQFAGSLLMRGLIQTLAEEGFITLD
jgi:Fic family protein